MSETKTSRPVSVKIHCDITFRLYFGPRLRNVSVALRIFGQKFCQFLMSTRSATCLVFLILFFAVTILDEICNVRKF
jgi:hypothetical protein